MVDHVSRTLVGLPLIERQFEQRGVPRPAKEYRFAQAAGRQWRFDYCWPDYTVALEVEGGAFSNPAVDVDSGKQVYLGGRHSRGRSFMNDIEKYNFAALRGWLLLRCTHDTIKSRRAVEDVIAALVIRGWEDKGYGREG
jgi:hypothetical protein